MQAVLRSWGDRREQREAVLEFLRLQMAVHHPQGAATEEEGAWWGDRDLWARQLARMWCNVVDTTIRNRTRQLARNSKNGGGRVATAQEVQLDPQLLDLAVSLVRLWRSSNSLKPVVRPFVRLSEKKYIKC